MVLIGDVQILIGLFNDFHGRVLDGLGKIPVDLRKAIT
jgi:hypothetical protein